MPEKDKDPADKKPENAGAQDNEADKKPDGASDREGNVDWKDLLQIEREGRERAERERDSYRGGVKRLEKELRRKKPDSDPMDPEDPEADEEDKPITRRDLKDVIEPMLGQGKVDALLSGIADPAKREYVREIYNNRIRRTGTSDEAIRADIEAALDLANAKTFKKENDELKRMNDNRVYVPPAPGSGGGGGDKTPQRKAHQWTPEQEAALERRAMSVGIDPEKYKEHAWRELQAGTAFSVKPKPKN